MKKLVATVKKDWGEIGFGSRKREGWSWEVTYYLYGRQIDQAYYSSEMVAVENAALFEAGHWEYGQYGSVKILEVKPA